MKNIRTIVGTVVGVIAVTAGFAGAETVLAGGAANFPYFHLGTLIIAGLIISGLKVKYDAMRSYEAVGAMALYAILIALFTNPVVMTLKNLVG